LLCRACLGGEPVKNAHFKLPAAITIDNPSIFARVVVSFDREGCTGRGSRFVNFDNGHLAEPEPPRPNA
jgi:hypothetical protein